MTKSGKFLTVATCLTLLGAGTVRHREIALVFSLGALYYIARFFYEDWKERRIEQMNERAKEAALQKKGDGSDEFAHIVRRAEFLNNMKEIERREKYAGGIEKKTDSPENDVLCV